MKYSMLQLSRAEDLFSQFVPGGFLGKFFNFPLSRVFMIAIFLMPLMLINSLVVFQVIEKLQEPLATQIDMIRMVLTFPLLIISYGFYCRIFEKRQAKELSFEYFWQEVGLGALVGSLLVVFMVGILALTDSYKIIEFRSLTILSENLLKFAVGALLQDIVLLCIVYRLAEEFAGSWIAIFVTLLIFSFAHIQNPNETLGSVLFLFFSSIIFISPFILTRRLWLSWGFHASWNFMQAGVFGMPNSGIDFPGWIIPQIDGPLWLTGGSVGIEASYIAIALDVIIGIVLLIIAIKKNLLVAPRWKRQISVTEEVTKL